MTAVQTNAADMTTLTHTHTYTHIHAHCIYTLSRHDAALMKSTKEVARLRNYSTIPVNQNLGCSKAE